MTKTNFEKYLELSDYGKMIWLENAKKELEACLKDSNKLLKELEGTDADEEGQIKAQLELNQKWLRDLSI